MMTKKETIIKRFDALADNRQYWINRNRYYYDEQKKYFRFLVSEGLSILELGCGTGELLNALKPKRGVGIDFSAKMMDIAKKKYSHLEFRLDDIEQINGWGETFDILILADVVGHLMDLEETFRRLHIFCRADTRIIISYYNFLWEPILKMGEIMGLKMPQQYQNWLSSEDICNLLSLARFQVVKSESRLLFPKRIPWLSSFINQYLASLPGLRRLCLCQYIIARPIKQKKKKEFTTTILIPCKNEKGNIEPAVKRIPNFGRHQEIIFVDGHSTDNTQEEIYKIIKAYPDKDIKFMVQNGQGKGDAVRKGFASARGDILMILDADLTVPPEDLTKFYLALVEDHGEFINGCRLIYPMEKQAMRVLNFLGNKFFSMMFTWILNQRFKDTLCGTKALFRADYEKIQAGRNYFGDFDPFGDFDLIFGAIKQNLKVVEVPIRYRERTYGQTNISRFRHGWLLLKMTIFAYRKIKAI
ncbi:MAG: bifunctional class I SAM-dependent methyltransferase/glycosyltransferase family 2 protein [Deltaproteobacteria bacterium]|jgi:SAM-dependent methyltransferase|nr:bifunctional class I SAM-dependent methyltransferase/glycosyltransferase family 2 protein [Deltaproteobacteria bacterium]